MPHDMDKLGNSGEMDTQIDGEHGPLGASDRELKSPESKKLKISSLQQFAMRNGPGQATQMAACGDGHMVDGDDVTVDAHGSHWQLDTIDIVNDDGVADAARAMEQGKPKRLHSDKENVGPASIRVEARPQRQARQRISYVIFDDSEDDEKDAEVEEEKEEEETDTVQLAGPQSVENIHLILDSRRRNGIREMRVKYRGLSFRKTEWVDRDVLIYNGKNSLVNGFEKRLAQGKINPYGDLVEGLHKDWLIVDRIVTSRRVEGGMQYLVKWKGRAYEESTWEIEEDLTTEEDLFALQKYERILEDERKKVALDSKKTTRANVKLSAVPAFENGRKLRSYQIESLKWMVKNWHASKNCILGDEMGLGKTAQSISVLEFQRQFGNVNGPFLVIAPLTTLGHWRREIETWTTMNCLEYFGTAEDKKIINMHEFWCMKNGLKTRIVKPDVVLTSYEHVLRDARVFQSIAWETMIIDEAHRMKDINSGTRVVIADIPCQWTLLLTGTPIQNNVKELFSLMNLLDPNEFNDEAVFLERYGSNPKSMTPEQVLDLQSSLKPYLLRRMKEDVETLPEKEECIIWVQLTSEQRAYYKAIFEKQIGTLLAGSSSKNLPQLRNISMELRKVCCHPFLCDGIEEDMEARLKQKGEKIDGLKMLLATSGKMQLLHKLLQKLRREKRKVLIFSQFKIMLDILEDYCNLPALNYPVERIDGGTSHRNRQAAIDRFSGDESDGFIFLLSTRAGGQGITLTAADTCIIYDSDWNPQNDLQAMARCHRIGQEKDVTIYRLVSRDTYEENVFETSSRKYGLDEAVLGGIGSGDVSGSAAVGLENDGKRISELLKHGAHCLKSDAKAEEETEAFLSENIDEILSRRTEKRQIGGRKGNTFSTATFESKQELEQDDKTFWNALLPEAVKAHENNKIGLETLPPRRRKSVSYKEKRNKGDDMYAYGSDSDKEYKAPMIKKLAKTSQSKKRNETKKWSIAHLDTLFDGLMRFGMRHGNTAVLERAVEYAGIQGKYPVAEICIVSSLLYSGYKKCIRVAPTAPRQKIRNPRCIFGIEENTEIEKEQQAYEQVIKTALLDVLDSFNTLEGPIMVPESAVAAFFGTKLWERILRQSKAYSKHMDGLHSIEDFVIDATQQKLPFVGGSPPKWLYIEDEFELISELFKNGFEPMHRNSRRMKNDMEIIFSQNGYFSKRFVCLPEGAVAINPMKAGRKLDFLKVRFPSDSWDSFLDYLVSRLRKYFDMFSNKNEMDFLKKGISGVALHDTRMRRCPFLKPDPAKTLSLADRIVENKIETNEDRSRQYLQKIIQINSHQESSPAEGETNIDTSVEVPEQHVKDVPSPVEDVKRAEIPPFTPAQAKAQEETRAENKTPATNPMPALDVFQETWGSFSGPAPSTLKESDNMNQVKPKLDHKETMRQKNLSFDLPVSKAAQRVQQEMEVIDLT